MPINMCIVQTLSTARMSDDGIITAKCKLLDMFAEFDDSELEYIEKWISSQDYKKDLDKKKTFIKGEKKLKKIGSFIKKYIPFEAEMATEIIETPTVGDQTDCKKENTCHVDEFLYDENQVEDLVKKGKLQRHYCLECKSHNVKELTYISHSMSRKALQYIFYVLLPKELENKQLVDVGSRLGAVLYAAYYFSNVSKILGVEINKEFCEMQDNIIDILSMEKEKIKIIHSDVTNREDIVESADIIIINVLDFFVDVEKHKEMWFFFKKHIKKGSYLITNRSMAETLGYLEIFEEFSDWLSICKPYQLDNEIFFDVEDYSELYLYTIN